jgi:hypothetical protein
MEGENSFLRFLCLLLFKTFSLFEPLALVV